MAEYLAEYRINVCADSCEEAARIAQDCCLNPEYNSRVWSVTDERGDAAEVHLDASGRAMVDRDLCGLANG